MIESIEKDVKSYEAKASAMLGAINTSIFFIVLFSIYILMPDFFQSICEILSRTMWRGQPNSDTSVKQP